MNKTYLVGSLASMFAIGFVAGRMSPPSSAGVTAGPEEPGNAKARIRAGGRPPADAANTAFARLRQEIRSAAPDQLAGLLYRALEPSDPFVQRALLDELYARMDATNFVAMSDALNRISLETGRAHHDEWLLLHTRTGQVAGQAAMDRFSAAAALGGQPAGRALWGWASTDPEAARKWLDAHAELAPDLRDRLLSSIASAAILHDPDRAIGMLAALPEAVRNRSSNEFCNQLVQHCGKDRAIEWLKSVRAAEPDSDFAASVSRQVFDRAVWAGANQTNAAVMVRDLEQLAAIMPIDEGWISRAMGQIRDRKVTGGIDLLDQIARNPALKEIPLSDGVWHSAVGHALQRNRESVATWLENHPDSPIHDSVAAMYSGSRMPGP